MKAVSAQVTGNLGVRDVEYRSIGNYCFFKEHGWSRFYDLRMHTLAQSDRRVRYSKLNVRRYFGEDSAA